MLLTPPVIQSPRPLGWDLGESAKLHCCVVISNPVRYASRYKLYEAFVAQTAGPHVELWTVEVAYGDRPFIVTQSDNPRHLQLRTYHELWHKENALNLLFQRVLQTFPAAEYFAWIDADITFVRPDWAYETIQKLQHNTFVQMFSHAQDVCPKYSPMPDKQFKSFMYAYHNDPTFGCTDKRFGYSALGHPGFCWAARRSALDTVGGLLDFAITGGADRHMACGLVGTMERSGPYPEAELKDLVPNFRNMLYLWQERAQDLHRNVGYVDGLILHNYHGKKTNRKYGERWQIYTSNAYDPIRDLVRDTQGLYQLPPTRVGLRDDLRCYFRSREEDSIDV